MLHLENFLKPFEMLLFQSVNLPRLTSRVVNLVKYIGFGLDLHELLPKTIVRPKGQ